MFSLESFFFSPSDGAGAKLLYRYLLLLILQFQTQQHHGQDKTRR
jgi:hypothetical protein